MEVYAAMLSIRITKMQLPLPAHIYTSTAENSHIGTMKRPVTNIPSRAPKLSYASLWYDETNDIFYSGTIGRVSYFDSPDPPPLSLWSFKPDGTGSGTWKEEIPAGNPIWDNLTRTTYGYQASGGNTALVLGGVATSMTSPETENIPRDTLQPGLVEFDMTTRQFTNSSAQGFNANGTGSQGQMHFVPSFGPNGLFLIMGGHNGSDHHYGFENIWVYEAVTHKWYNQTASGNVPAGRREFCVAGINSTDETYEIFLYGGDNSHLGSDAVPYDEIFILTLPAFRWFKKDFPPQHPRGGHTCNAVGGSQIISIGGFDANSKIFLGSYDDIRASTFNSSTDPFAQGLGIFNMTSLTWADHYTANAPPYEQSDLVRTFYRENPQDGSQFSTTGLKDLFQTTHFTPADTTKSHNTNTTGTPAPESDSSSSHSGTIAGGVVGGVLGIAAIAGTVFYFYKRMKRRDAEEKFPISGNGVLPDLKIPLHPLVEADARTQFRGVQLEGHGIQELQQHPTEMSADSRSGGAFNQDARYELGAAHQRW
ncbi:MAG: hypothetical protein Q9166_006290 [cf. Caloplaca sp. 2 TL-2023]